MARFPRVNIAGALYYITSRGDQAEKIFMDDKDYMYCLGLVKKYKIQFKFKLFAYALLPDHFHLLIELSRHSTISQIMHSLNSNYTKYFNSRTGRQGHLFQQRYKMTVVEKRTHLLPVTAYIHTNPKAIKLTEENERYLYSSLPEYLKSDRPKDTEGLLPDITKEINEVTQGPLKQKGLVSYKEYMSGVSSQKLAALSRDLAKKPAIGSQKFIRRVNMRIKAGAFVYGYGKPAKVWRRHVLMTGAIVILVALGANLYIFARAQSRRAEASRQLQRYYQKQVDEYYKGVSKNLQIEKQKTTALEQRLINKQTGNGGGSNEKP